ncbi:MAG: O-antigen ligase family protein [Steroidobacterales bacterium]
MPIALKELLVVLGLGVPLFAFAKPAALLFTAEGDFRLRRTIWLTLTIVAFLSPNFWLFAAIAAPVMYWGGRKDTNPVAFFLLLMNVIPPISVPIPPILINDLFSLDIFRLLSFCVLIPVALRIRKSKASEQIKGLKVMDLALLGFGAIYVLLYVPPDLPNHVITQNSLTNDIRSACLYLVDIYTLYYVASRTCIDRKKLLDALAAFCLSCCLMALTAVFESAKHWLLYTGINIRWGGNSVLDEYYMRDNLLRAQGPTGEPLSLAFLLVIGFGFWLYLQSHVKSTRTKVAVMALLCAGLLVTFSRGPWLAALVIYLAYAAFDPRGLSRVFKATAIVLLLATALLASPLGTKISGMIPFMGGTVDKDTLTYREQLLDRSWELIKARPLLGDQLALSKMQDLRQGQGIIDVVNAYVGVTLFYGFTGLAVFLTFVLSALAKAYAKSRRVRKTDPDSALLGANLAAAIVANLLLLADGSLGTGPKQVFYILMGLAGAYAAVSSARTAVTAGQRAVGHDVTIDASPG